MRYLIAVLLFSSPAFADDKPKKPKPAPKVADVGDDMRGRPLPPPPPPPTIKREADWLEGADELGEYW